MRFTYLTQFRVRRKLMKNENVNCKGEQLPIQWADIKRAN